MPSKSMTSRLLVGEPMTMHCHLYFFLRIFQLTNHLLCMKVVSLVMRKDDLTMREK